MNISINDYYILLFISKNPNLTEKEICAKVKNCNSHRIALMWRGNYIRNTKESDENWPAAQYVITDAGITIIQDFRAYKKMLWTEKAKIPIVVSLITTILGYIAIHLLESLFLRLI